MGRRPARGAVPLERAEGLSAVGNAGVRRGGGVSAGVAPCRAALVIRAIALELERIYNHAAAIAMMCQSTGLSVGQAAAEIVLERLLRVTLPRLAIGTCSAWSSRRRATAPDLAACATNCPLPTASWTG